MFMYEKNECSTFTKLSSSLFFFFIIINDLHESLLRLICSAITFNKSEDIEKFMLKISGNLVFFNNNAFSFNLKRFCITVFKAFY